MCFRSSAAPSPPFTHHLLPGPLPLQVVTFLKWANEQPNTWFLTYQQLIAYYSAVSSPKGTVLSS